MKKRGIDVSVVGIILSAIGIIASIGVIVLNLIDGERIAVGIALFCACSATLATNVRNKKDKK